MSIRPSLVLACVLAGLLSCGKNPPTPTSGSSAITGTLQLTIEADPADGASFWAILGRDGAFQKEDYRIEKVRAGVRTPLAWREEVDGPRDWKLTFGPTKHPTYSLIVVPDSGEKPVVEARTLDSFHDGGKSLAMAYFGIPLDGERELQVNVKKAAPLEILVTDPAGAPLEGVRIVGIPTPRYLFKDGFSPERVDETHLSWPWAFWNWDHVPNQKGKPAQIITARTDAKGACVLDAFVGWVGISERDERCALPRSVLALPDVRSQRFVVVQKPASVRLTVEGLPGKDYPTPERGVLVEGEWPLPGGAAPGRWSERLSYLQGKSAEFFTPCKEVRVIPLTRVHRVATGDVIKDLQPGESRKHRADFEEIPHKTIEGEVHLDAIENAGREHCGIELYDGGDPARLIRPLGTVGGPGVPKSGRVPFIFHVMGEGPFALAIHAGNYPWTVVREVKAPKEELVIRLNPEPKNIRCDLKVRARDGSEVSGWIVGTWPQRDLINEFRSGTSAYGKPGLNTFIVHSSAGNAVLRDVKLEEGQIRKLEATLGAGVKVSGRLVDPEGKPLAGHWVHLSWPGYFRMPNAYRWLADLTGEDGRFEISQVPPGPWRLYVKRGGAPVGKAFSVPADGGAMDAGDLILSRTDAPGTK